MFQAYLVTCSVSGRRYIGITGSAQQAQVEAEHVADAASAPTRPLTFHAAIRKHGEAAFHVTPLFVALTYGALLEAERALYFAMGHTLAPRGLQSVSGRGRLRLASKGLPQRGRLCRHPRSCSKRRSAETRKRLSQAKMGISQNVGERNPGAKLSAEDARQIFDQGLMEKDVDTTPTSAREDLECHLRLFGKSPTA